MPRSFSFCLECVYLYIDQVKRAALHKVVMGVVLVASAFNFLHDTKKIINEILDRIFKTDGIIRFKLDDSFSYTLREYTPRDSFSSPIH